MKPYSSSHPTLSDPKMLVYPITLQLRPFQRGCLFSVSHASLILLPKPQLLLNLLSKMPSLLQPANPTPSSKALLKIHLFSTE